MELSNAAIGLQCHPPHRRANFVMYVTARPRALNALDVCLERSAEKANEHPANQSMDELRKRVEELEKKQNGK
jgi:hypothetical protein